MVTEVSATLVATTTLRNGLGAKARSCSSGGNSPCKGISARRSRVPRRAAGGDGRVDLPHAGHENQNVTRLAGLRDLPSTMSAA